MKTETIAIPETILDAFKKWIAQPHRLDRNNYGFDRAEGRQAYWDDARKIGKDKLRAQKALRDARRYPFNPDAMASALQGSYSGRLQWVDDAFEYTTGQYFPTEYAQAAAAVLESYAQAVRPKFVPTPEQRSQWWTIGDIERANYNAGGHWFSPDTKKFFRSRILGDVYQGTGGIYFVSSEKSPSGPRAFTIREFNPVDASIDTFCDSFQTLTRSRAQRIARLAADNRRAAAVELGLRYEVRNNGAGSFVNWDTKYDVQARADHFTDVTTAQLECDKLNGI
jgi:hypothetical protein